MFSWIFSCLLIVISIAYSKANPIQQSAISAFDEDTRSFKSDNSILFRGTGRGSYFDDDFFEFPSEYYNGRYYDPYYVNYAPRLRPIAPKPRPIAPTPSPVAAYVPRRKSQRRQGLGSTTQKYTVCFGFDEIDCKNVYCSIIIESN